jgi:hypothetical protein
MSSRIFTYSNRSVRLPASSRLRFCTCFVFMRLHNRQKNYVEQHERVAVFTVSSVVRWCDLRGGDFGSLILIWHRDWHQRSGKPFPPSRHMATLP